MSDRKAMIKAITPHFGGKISKINFNHNGKKHTLTHEERGMVMLFADYTVHHPQPETLTETVAMYADLEYMPTWLIQVLYDNLDGVRDDIWARFIYLINCVSLTDDERDELFNICNNDADILVAKGAKRGYRVIVYEDKYIVCGATAYIKTIDRIDGNIYYMTDGTSDKPFDM
jgi:hypothetical protein